MTESPHRPGFRTRAPRLPKLPSKGKFAGNTEARLVPAGPASPHRPRTPPQRSWKRGRPGLCTLTRSHSRTRTHSATNCCEFAADRGAEPPDPAAPSFPLRGIRLGARRRMHDMRGLALGTSSGRRRKDCTGAFLCLSFFLRKGEKKKKAQPKRCAPTPLRTGEGGEEECVRRGLPARAPARPSGRAARVATRPPPPPGRPRRGYSAKGGIDRARCLSAAETHPLTHTHTAPSPTP